MKTGFVRIIVFTTILYCCVQSLSLVAQEEINAMNDNLCSVNENNNNVTSKWHKRGMFLFGCFNGFYLPLAYALALGFNVVDLSDPVMKENLQPFAKGATIGIGCWFAYKIIQWYLQLAVLKTLNAALQNPVINKVVRESEVLQKLDINAVI